MPWQRPKSVPTGQVWLRFEGKSKDGSPAPKFQIRELEPEHRQECIELMLDTFARDEPLCKVLDVKSEPASMHQIQTDWEQFIDQGISVACFQEVGGRPARLAGFNILAVRCRGEEDDVYGTKGEQWRKLLRTLQEAEDQVDVFSLYGVEEYLTCSGMAVKKEFRGQSIGVRILEARKPLCKALGLSATASVFTAKSSQVVAARAGFEVLGTLDYKDMMKHGVDLSGCETSRAEVRGLKYDF